MDGLIYVISQLGLALSQANEKIAQLQTALNAERQSHSQEVPLSPSE